ncbi:MAG: Fur family transcriptional regulator [Opitutales bacterium]
MKEQRDTRQRKAIKFAFAHGNRPLSPKEVLELASAQVPNLGIATVYRNIKGMVEQGELEVVELPGQAPRYCLPNGNKQAPLIVCERTDRVFQLKDQDVSVQLPDLPEGFKLKRAEIFLYGEFAEETAEAPRPEPAHPRNGNGFHPTPAFMRS